jgi:hypothetical protein
VAIFSAAKMIINLPYVADWSPPHLALAPGSADVRWLLLLAIAAGLLMRVVQLRLAADLHRRRAIALQDENTAVVRACRAVAHGFAQPLTGLVAYTEMLAADCSNGTEAQRRDLEGLREGVIRLERSLQCLRDAVQYTPDMEDCRHIADEVERALAASDRSSRR